MMTKGLIKMLNKKRIIWQRVDKPIKIIPESIDDTTTGVIHSCKYCHKHYIIFQDGETRKPPNYCAFCERKFEQWKNLLIDIEEQGKPCPNGDKLNGMNFIPYWEEQYKSNTCCFCGEEFGFYPYVNMGTKENPTWVYAEGLLPRACPACGEKYKPSILKKNYFKSYKKAPDYEVWKYKDKSEVKE